MLTRWEPKSPVDADGSSPVSAAGADQRSLHSDDLLSSRVRSGGTVAQGGGAAFRQEIERVRYHSTTPTLSGASFPAAERHDSPDWPAAPPVDRTVVRSRQVVSSRQTAETESRQTEEIRLRQPTLDLTEINFERRDQAAVAEAASERQRDVDTYCEHLVFSHSVQQMRRLGPSHFWSVSSYPVESGNGGGSTLRAWKHLKK